MDIQTPLIVSMLYDGVFWSKWIPVSCLLLHLCNDLWAATEMLLHGVDSAPSVLTNGREPRRAMLKDMGMAASALAGCVANKSLARALHHDMSQTIRTLAFLPGLILDFLTVWR